MVVVVEIKLEEEEVVVIAAAVVAAVVVVAVVEAVVAVLWMEEILHRFLDMLYGFTPRPLLNIAMNTGFYNIVPMT